MELKTRSYNNFDVVVCIDRIEWCFRCRFESGFRLMMITNRTGRRCPAQPGGWCVNSSSIRWKAKQPTTTTVNRGVNDNDSLRPTYSPHLGPIYLIWGGQQPIIKDSISLSISLSEGCCKEQGASAKFWPPATTCHVARP